MAAATKRLAFCAWNCSRQISSAAPPSRRIVPSNPSRVWRPRHFTTTSRVFTESKGDKPIHFADPNLNGDDEDEYTFDKYGPGQDIPVEDRELFDTLNEATERLIEAMPNELEERQPPPSQPTFWTSGEEKEMLDEFGPDDDDYVGDDMSALGHGNLEQHREMREYARLAAWELPLLAQFAKPFEPPTSARPLRFRYTTYLGESHPAARKVVCEFTPSDIPDLTQVQRNKLIKLVGARYNPSADVIKMSCESFPESAQNKRYLGDLVDNLIKEAEDPSDTFEDVPFDFRHHKPKPRYEYPEQWLLTPERKKALEERRTQRLIAEQQRFEEGRVVDGIRVIQEAFLNQVKEAPLMVEAAKGKGAAVKGSRSKLR